MKKILLFTVFIGCFCYAEIANATHFRYGNISWRWVSGNTIEFKVQQAWRRTFFFGPPNVGSTVNTGTLFFGDGFSQAINLSVTQVNLTDDWFFGETTITHTYTNPGEFTAYFSSCCRISTLENGADNSFYMETDVIVGPNNDSPIVNTQPIFNINEGISNATLQVAASDPDGDNVRYRFPTTGFGGESEGINFAAFPNLNINPNTGLISFDASTFLEDQLYAIAAVVEELDNAGDVNSKVMVDFIIRIIGPSDNNVKPEFDYTVTPANNTSFDVSPGQNVNFSVEAFDTDAGDIVTLSAIGLPPGATLVPALPTTGNPVSTTFDWTPTSGELGNSLINFIATDNSGQQSTTAVNIVVSEKPQFDFPPTPPKGVHIVLAPGETLDEDIQASDPDPTDVVILTASDVAGKGNLPGATFTPTLPTAAANPVSTNIVWVPQPSDWGHNHKLFTATDGIGDKATYELQVLVNTTPVFTSTPVTSVNATELYSYNITVDDPDIPYGDMVDIISTLALPPWLNFTDNGDGTALLSGTPPASEAGKTFNINLEAQDIHHHSNPGGIPNQSFMITVNSLSTSCAIWNGTAWVDGKLPDASTCAIIQNGQLSTSQDYVSLSLEVKPGAQLLIEDATTWEVKEDVIVDGELTVNSGGSFINYDGQPFSGKVTYKRKSRFTGDDHAASLRSAPVQPATTADLGDYTWKYIQSKNKYKMHNGALATGIGYYTFCYDETSFMGVPNTGDIKVTKSSNKAYGMLVGNPYTAAINAEQFLSYNSSDISPTIWIWNPSGTPGYLTYNELGIVGGNTDDISFDGYIGASQGFFVEFKPGGSSVTFKENMRVNGNNSDATFLRVANNTESKKSQPQAIKLALQGNNLFDETLIGFTRNATEEYDAGLDAKKMSIFPLDFDKKLWFYSLLNSERLAIQGLPDILPTSDMEISIGGELPVPGKYSISIRSNDLPNDLEIVIKDVATGKLHDLKQRAFHFVSDQGSLDGRFQLLLGRGLLQNVSEVRLHAQPGQLTVWVPNDITSGRVSILSLSGQTIATFDNEDMQNNNEYFANLKPGQVYLVVINSDAELITQKVIVY